MRLGKPDQVQFVFLPLAQPHSRIAIRPKLSLSDVMQAGNLDRNPKNGGLNRIGQKRLIPCVRSELNPQFATGRLRVQRMRVLFDLEALTTKMRGELWEALRDNHDIGIQRIYRLDITVNRQTA